MMKCLSGSHRQANVAAIRREPHPIHAKEIYTMSTEHKHAGKILITSATGNIGSEMIQHLLAMEADIHDKVFLVRPISPDAAMRADKPHIVRLADETPDPV